MELLTDQWDHFQRFYNNALDRADGRVADWPLMQGYTPTLALTAAYLISLVVIERFMRHRQPLNVKYLVIFYNFALVALNFHIFYEVFTVSWRRNYSYTCQPVDYSDNPDEIRMAKALWWYYFSKLIEFLDTVFFLLRKKNNQVSFLHVYHHATMFPIWWMGIKWVPGGQSFFGAMINSFIHVLMYTYYGIASMGPQYQKYLWWKRYLTKIQLIQFVAGMSHAGRSLYVGCNFPKWMQWALVFYGLSILLLFLNFYFHAYVRPTKESKKSVANGESKKRADTRNGFSVANGVSKKHK